MLGVVIGYDCTHQNLPTVPPKSQLAGYTTGSPDIAWTALDFDNHPGSLRICQNAGATDTTADYLDVETGAATFADCPGWYRATLENYQTSKRPGQRHPSIYCSASNVTPVANALVAGGVTSGPGLIVADWDLTQPQAVTDVQDAAGPFPIRGIQFHNDGTFDIDVWDLDWVQNISGAPFRHVLTGTVEQFAAARDANTMNLLARSIKLWTPADKSQIADTARGLVVYTVNP